MKSKLAIMAAVATMVTVGGVYATWTFSEGSVVDATTTVNVAMTGVTTNTEKGTLAVTVMGEGGFTLSVDDSNNDHYPEIMKTGAVTVTFTPSATASDDVKTNGIDVQLAISYAPYTGGPASLEEWKYETTQIFEVAAEPLHLEGASATESGGVFTWTVAAGDIGIDLTTAMKAVLIDTFEKYGDLNEILAKGHFVLTVSECTNNHNP